MNWSGSDTELIKDVHEMYTEKLIGECNDCRGCRDLAYEYLKNKQNLTLSAPVGIWHIGDLFKDDKFKVVFVGKTAIGGKEIEFDNDSCFGKNILLKRGEEWENILSNRLSPFWRYMREIITLLYPNLTEDERVRNIAVTNLMKCNIYKKDNSGYKDMTTEDMKRICLNEAKIFEKEMEILKPQKIIIMTGRGYDTYINKFSNQLKILRMPHPQGQKKQEFVDRIVEWIKNE